jgi:histidinol-phosphate aminotransferase
MSVDFRELANSMVRSLTPYQPGKPIEELERELGITSSIKLASNENPLGASPLVMKAVELVLNQSHIYPDGSCYELKQALAQFLSVLPQQITVGNGSENVLELIVKSYLHKDDEAVISQYAFLTIPLLIHSYGAKAITVPAKQFGHDILAMIRAITSRTRVLFIVNPNNPTGTYTSCEDFILLMQSLPPHVLVVVDEAYVEYVTASDYPNTLSLLAHYPNLIIIRTFSKAYGLAGLRLGYSISSLDIADILNRARLPFNVNYLAIKSGCIALSDQMHIKKSREITELGREQFIHDLKKLKLNFIPSIANFITIEVDNADKIYEQLLLKGVIVRPLTAYQLPQHIRVTIGTEIQNTRFLTALQNLLG